MTSSSNSPFGPKGVAAMHRKPSFASLRSVDAAPNMSINLAHQLVRRFGIRWCIDDQHSHARTCDAHRMKDIGGEEAEITGADMVHLAVDHHLRLAFEKVLCLLEARMGMCGNAGAALDLTQHDLHEARPIERLRHQPRVARA